MIYWSQDKTQQNLNALRKAYKIDPKSWPWIKELEEYLKTGQNGLKEKGFNIGKTNTCVTPVFLEGEIPEPDIEIKLAEHHFDIGKNLLEKGTLDKAIEELKTKINNRRDKK